MCGKKIDFITISFKNKQGKLIVTCSIECWKKVLPQNQNNDYQTKTFKQKSSQANQPIFSPSSKPKNYLLWIIGGLVFVAGIGTVFLLFKKVQKKKND